MLSRVAASIYWMSRQAERAENHARFLEVTMNMVLEQPDYVADPWDPLVQVTGDNDWFEEKYGKANSETVVQFLGFDRNYHSSMLTCLHAARENARGVREALSTESFEQLNEFYHFVGDTAPQHYTDPTADFFEQVRSHAMKWKGVIDSTMSHDTAWHFLNLGRNLERADKTSRILDAKYFSLLPRVEDVGTAVDDLQWSTLLMAISGLETYRREHHLMDVEKVVGFFLFHKTFPRSVYSCISNADWSLREIEKCSAPNQPGQAKLQMTILRDRLKSTNAKEVISAGMHEFIDQLQIDLNEIGKTLGQDYFYAPHDS